MHTKIQVLLTAFVVLALPASASASFAHVVTKGESLSSVAATDGLSVAQLAAANGLSPNAELTTGSTLQIPPQSASASTVGSGGDESAGAAAPVTSSGGGYVVQPGDTLSGIAAANGISVRQLAAENGLSPSGVLVAGTTLNLSGSGSSSSASSATAAPVTASSAGGYLVQSGDTLSGIAAANGISVRQLAAENRLSPSGVLLAGSTLSLSGSGSSSSASSAPATTSGGGYLVQPGDTLSGIAAADGISVRQLAADNGLDPSGVLLAGSTLSVPGSSASAGGAQPTPQMVSAADVGQVAADNGVPPSLAEAIGYQESGFNNDLVSSTGATGVMQIEPGTWNYIQRNLSGPLSPVSAQDNIRGGVLLLRSLLQQTGGDPGLAAAGYYQGLRSVERHGMYNDTRRYVADVTSLQRSFGGP
jgi:LysM repeat protein